MPYYDEATFRRAFGSERVTGYFPDSAGLEEAIEMAEDRVYAALTAAGHGDKSPSSYAAPSAAPGVIRRACLVALKEEAYGRAGLAIVDLFSEDQRAIFDRIRDGSEEIPGVSVDDTTRSVGGMDYTDKGLSATASSRNYSRVFGRGQMKTAF